MEYDEKYMRRALQLAANSKFDTHPNPRVGAVIVCDGRIIGEGCHRRCGEGHAEVNAVASVADKSQLSRSTMYVTLEPCSHYGKTPPCAKLIIDSKIPRVVVGAVDPFEKVAGRGVAMLRDAGVEVVTGVLADESRALNKRFFTAHTLRRPYITLKWAQSADGFMDWCRDAATPPFSFSTPETTMLVHRQRALHDGILTTAATVVADNPSLTVRDWSGPDPRRIVIDRKGILTAEILKSADHQANGASTTPISDNISALPSEVGSAAERFNVFKPSERPALLYTSRPFEAEGVECVTIDPDTDLEPIMADLYGRGVTSLLVEAGPRLLQRFIDADLYDRLRIERSPLTLGPRGAHPAPAYPSSDPRATLIIPSK